MKSIYKIIISIYLILYSCNENIGLKENDVVKYDYLKIFVLNGQKDFKGIHDIDSDRFEFSYKVQNTELSLSEIDLKAKKEGWAKYNKSNIISYTKKIKIFESKLDLVVVNIKLENSNRIFIEVK